MLTPKNLPPKNLTWTKVRMAPMTAPPNRDPTAAPPSIPAINYKTSINLCSKKLSRLLSNTLAPQCSVPLFDSAKGHLYTTSPIAPLSTCNFTKTTSITTKTQCRTYLQSTFTSNPSEKPSFALTYPQQALLGGGGRLETN